MIRHEWSTASAPPSFPNLRLEFSITRAAPPRRALRVAASPPHHLPAAIHRPSELLSSRRCSCEPHSSSYSPPAPRTRHGAAQPATPPSFGQPSPARSVLSICGCRHCLFHRHRPRCRRLPCFLCAPAALLSLYGSVVTLLLSLIGNDRWAPLSFCVYWLEVAVSRINSY